MTNPAALPELVQDSKLELTTFRDNLTIHSKPLGQQQRTETWKRGEMLGHGGYGVVMLEHRVDDIDATGAEGSPPRERAVKMVLTQGRQPIHYVRELEALAKFSQAKYSGFFVTFLGWFESPKYLHITMEYCPHGDLKNYLSQSGGRLPESEVKVITSQVLAGIMMMHQAGFAHRDIKPGVSNPLPPSSHAQHSC
jgi:serine/threonine protein kinase